MAETELLYFMDAFGKYVRPGDEVVYILGDRAEKRLARGVIEKIGHNEERTYGKTRYYVRCTWDNARYSKREGGLSPLEHTDRIMKVDKQESGV